MRQRLLCLPFDPLPSILQTMADPFSAVAALGLAAYVAQMVDYSLHIVSKSKGFRKSLDGAIPEHHHTAVVTASLRGASATLASHLGRCIGMEKGFEGETQLTELAVDCEGIARSLLQELGLGAIRKFSERCNGIYYLVHS